VGDRPTKSKRPGNEAQSPRFLVQPSHEIKSREVHPLSSQSVRGDVTICHCTYRIDTGRNHDEVITIGGYSCKRCIFIRGVDAGWSFNTRYSHFWGEWCPWRVRNRYVKHRFKEASTYVDTPNCPPSVNLSVSILLIPTR
jgi:hypothetical protein